MTSKERRYFSGDTLEQALMQAARHYGIQPDEVAYQKMEKRHGFLRARRGVVIDVDPAAPRRSAATREVEEKAAAPAGVPSEELAERATPREVPTETEAIAPGPTTEEPRSGKGSPPDQPPRPPVSELAEAARKGLEEILVLARLDLEAEIVESDEQLDIELQGPDQEHLLEDRGNLLLAIQHLLPRLIRGYSGHTIPCHVDSGNFHAAREAELRELAEEAAQEVRRQQRPRTLPPMNPAERRIIHLTLAEDPQLVTESDGRGFFKRVTIRPAMRRPRGFDRYSR